MSLKRKSVSILNTFFLTKTKKRIGRVDLFWDAVKSYSTAFWLQTKLPVDFDVKRRRLVRTTSILRLLPWTFMAYFVAGVTSCLFKMIHGAYLYVVPTSLTGMTPKDYDEFGTLIQVFSIPIVVLVTGSSPVIGLFHILFGKAATVAVNAMIELEETLEQS